MFLYRVEFQEPIPASKCPLDENHPHYNQRACHIMGDSNVLIFGKRQAQVLTKTLTYNGLPENITNRVRNIEITPDIETQFKQSVMNAHLFDAHQEKLVKKKHPTKLMWVYKRDYGITDQRKKYVNLSRIIEYGTINFTDHIIFIPVASSPINCCNSVTS